MTEIPVHIYMVLDRSGSMELIKHDVIGGFNAFVEAQRREPGRCRLSMIQFDTQNPAQIVYDGVALDEIDLLDERTFVPRSGTPLLDAEGWMISNARQQEAERQKAGEEDEAVLFVTLTDGEENSSREWSYKALTKAKRKAEQDGWAFMYLGCGHDAYAQGARIGTHRSSTRSYGEREVGLAMGDMSAATSRYRVRSSRGARTTSSELFDEDR
jgi:Mg-chelatase subunit ChlD